MSEDWNRRSFLSTTAVAAAALALGTVPAQARDHDDYDDHREGSRAPLRVRRTTVEHAETLLGCDVAGPRFSWELSAEGRRGAEQSACQIRTVYSASGLSRRPVWDSGRVRSGRSVGVGYDGPALKPRTRYHWQVRVWGDKGRPSAWSPVHWWETALPEDGWKGQWIGPAGAVRLPPFDGRVLDLVRRCHGEQRRGRAALVPRLHHAVEGVQVAKSGIVVTADDDFTLYLDGERIAHQPQQPVAWKDGKFADITEGLTAGSRVQLAARRHQPRQQPGRSAGPAAGGGRNRARTAEFVTGDDFGSMGGAAARNVARASVKVVAVAGAHGVVANPEGPRRVAAAAHPGRLRCRRPHAAALAGHRGGRQHLARHRVRFPGADGGLLLRHTRRPAPDHGTG